MSIEPNGVFEEHEDAPEEPCGGCGLDMSDDSDYDGVVGSCDRCGAIFCEECFARMEADAAHLCPACGKPPFGGG